MAYDYEEPLVFSKNICLLFVEVSAKIKRVVTLSLLRMVFAGWRTVVTDSKKTREYFEVRQTVCCNIATPKTVEKFSFFHSMQIV